MLWICRDKTYEESMPSKRTISSYNSSFRSTSHHSRTSWWKKQKTELELSPAYIEWERKHNEELAALSRQREEQRKRDFEEKWKPSTDALQLIHDSYLEAGVFPENQENDPSNIDFVTQQEFKEDYGCDPMRRMRFEIMKKAATRGDLATMKSIHFQEKKLGAGWAISREHGHKYDEDGRHVIFHAMYAGQEEAMAFIMSIDEGATTARGTGSETPLWWAVMRCLHSTPAQSEPRRRILQRLLDDKHTQYGIQNKDFGGKTEFHLMAEEGDLDLFRFILETCGTRGYSRAEAIAVSDEKERTCFHTACLYGFPDMVEYMLSDDSGCRPSWIKDNEQWLKGMKDSDGKTPLDLAKEGQEQLRRQSSVSSKQEAPRQQVCQEEDSREELEEKKKKEEEFGKLISLLEKATDSGCCLM